MAQRQLWSDTTTTSTIPAQRTTALLLLNIQYGYRNTHLFGDEVSTPKFEQNITELISAFRNEAESLPEGQGPLIFHAQYRAPWSDSPFHSDHRGPYGKDGSEGKRGVDFMEFAQPRMWSPDKQEYVFIDKFDEKPLALGLGKDGRKYEQDEALMTSHGHSIFINTSLDVVLKNRGIKTLIVAGMPMEHSVSTAVRMAQNLALTGKWGGRGNMEDADEASLWTDGKGIYVDAPPEDHNAENGGLLVDMPRIVLVEDATRAFRRGGLDAETVHRVHVESLRDYVEIRRTEDVVNALKTPS